MGKRKATEPRRGVALLDLKHGCCRWPLGDVFERARFFCGKPATQRSYCEFHHAMSVSRPVAEAAE